MLYCFQCRNEEWFYKLSGLLEDEVFRCLIIEDGDELNPKNQKLFNVRNIKMGWN